MPTGSVELVRESQGFVGPGDAGLFFVARGRFRLAAVATPLTSFVNSGASCVAETM